MRRTVWILALMLSVQPLTSCSAPTQPNRASPPAEQQDGWITRAKDFFGVSSPAERPTTLPLLVTLPVEDSLSAGNDGSEAKSLKSFYKVDGITYSGTEVSALLTEQARVRSRVDGYKAIGAFSQYTTDKTIDLAAGLISRRSPAAAIYSGLLADGMKKAVRYFYTKQYESLDSYVAANFDSLLANNPLQGGTVTRDELTAFALKHKEALVGPDVLAQLKKSGATQAEIDKLLGTQITRVLGLVLGQSVDIATLKSALSTSALRKYVSYLLSFHPYLVLANGSVLRALLMW
jgi:hypothetical protein